MRPLIYALLLSMTGMLFQSRAATAQSSQEVTFVSCTDGGGCRCALSGMDAYSVASLLNNQDPPANADQLIILTDGSETKWSTLTPDAADAEYGGDGICPIEVFAPVLPEDGTWVGTVRATAITGCPDQVAAMVPGMVSGMVFSRQITWGNRFNPTQLSETPNSGVVTWTELTPVLYRGRLNTPGDQGILEIDGNLTASLVASDRATATLRLRIGSSGANATVLASLGMANCRTIAVYDFRKTGT
ncbi:MAG: hypothetical protein ACKVKF_17040 [Rhodobacterales bacterium]